MLAKRIVPCLDVRGGRVVKGKQFKHIQDVDDPVKLGKYYSDQMADELVFYDITATHAKRRLTHRGFLQRYAELLQPGGQVVFKSDNAGLFSFTLEEFEACHWPLTEVTFDLHHSGILNEAMTEYEAKFSAKGQPIFHCVATRPEEVVMFDGEAE